MDSDNVTDVGYFVFQDLSIRKEGEFRVKFSLFELQRCDLPLLFINDLLTSSSGDEGMTASYIKSVLSKAFKGETQTHTPLCCWPH